MRLFAPDPLIEQLRTDLAFERERNDRLTQTLIEMQRQGFTKPLPVGQAPRGPKYDARIKAAIAAHMAPNGAAAKETWGHVDAWLAEGKDIPQIVEMIHAGG